MHRGWIKISLKLIKLMGSLIPVMAAAVSLGVLGYLCSTFITVFSTMAVFKLMNFDVHIELKTLIILIVCCASLRGILRYTEQLSGHYIAFKLLAKLRDKVFKALRNLAPARLEVKNKGDLISLITSDIELIEVFYAHTVSPVFIALIVSTVMTLYIGSFDIAFGVIALISYIFIGVVIPVVNSVIGKTKGVVYRNLYSDLSSYLLDSLRGMREVMQYDLGKERIKHINDMSVNLESKQKELKLNESVTKSVTDICVYLFSVGILIFGSLKSGNIINIYGTVISTVALFSSFGPVIALSSLSNNLLHTMAAADRVLSLLEEEPETKEITKEENVKYKELEIKNVGFSYRDETVLDNANMKVDKNSLVGIKGKSGSGKSTLLKLMMRFWDVKEGKIEISRTDIKNINTENLRDMESYMTQRTFLFNDTIAENIRIGKLNASMDEIISAAKKASIYDFINSLPNGFHTEVGELGDRMSGGERQRIGLARVFLHGAPLIFLDEPTSNLDSLNEAVILKSLKENAKDRTMILVSHKESTLNITDHIYSLEEGRLLI